MSFFWLFLKPALNTKKSKKDRMPNQGSKVNSPMTFLTPSKRRKVNVDASDSTVTSNGISIVDFNKAMPRFCGNLDQLTVHMKNVGTLPNKNTRACMVCGGDTTKYCGVCGAALHYLTLHEKAKALKIPCFIWYHNPSFFGGARCDAGLCGIKLSEYKPPNTPEQNKYAEEIRRIQQSSSTETITTRTGDNTTPSNSARAARAATRLATAALENAGANNDTTSPNSETDEQLLARASASMATNRAINNANNNNDSSDEEGGVEVMAVEMEGGSGI